MGILYSAVGVIFVKGRYSKGWSNDMSNGQFPTSVIFCWVINCIKTMVSTTVILRALDSRGQQFELGSAGQFFCWSYLGSLMCLQ